MTPASGKQTPPHRRGVVDVFIATLLLVFAFDTMPCTPRPIRNLIEPLLDSIGLWQGTWSLFAPIPDSRNHRLRADLYYADGSHHVWNSPDWRSQSAWQRFVGHRESEYYENIWSDDNSAAWPGFAAWVARRETSRMGVTQRLVKVELSVIWGDLPPPEGNTWPSNSVAVPLDQERKFFTLLYPESL